MSVVAPSLPVPSHTAAHSGLHEAIAAICGSMAALQAGVAGPAVPDSASQLKLVASNSALLRAFQQSLLDYEAAGQTLPEAEVAVLRADTRELLHPYLLQSPFARRAFEKPLGYPGDYVMVRHIVGDQFAGETAFAQLLNFALLQSDVAAGHRNRIKVLQDLLERQAEIGHASGRQLKVLTIGCGPAEEVFRFINSSPYANHLDITLLDFSAETLDWTKERLDRACAETGRQPTLRYSLESVYNLAKQNVNGIAPIFDVVICAGLFDYLTDRFCKKVLVYGARSLVPGGTLLVTNVSEDASSFGMRELLGWELINRSAEHLVRLMPVEAGPFTVFSDETGTNVMAELRRT